MAETLNRALARGLDILTLLSEENQGMELFRVAKALALPKSSCSVLLHTLLDKGFLRYEEKSARYLLTPRLFELGSAALREGTVESLLRSAIREVARASEETVHCGLLDGDEVVYIDKVESTQSIRMTSRVGLRMPLYATAMGRAILAAMPKKQAETLLAGTELSPLTHHTVTDRRALRSLLNQVRVQGYATEYEETNPGVCCVGVAIQLPDGHPGYALSVSMPLFRGDDQAMARYAALLREAKEKVERMLLAGVG